MARPRTHNSAVRSRLLEAASQAIASQGREGLSLRAVAAEAGTTTAAVYSLFGHREALIEAVTQEGFQRFASRLSDVHQSDDPLTDLFALGMAYRANALQNPFFYRVMFSTAPGVQENSTFQTLVRAVARALGMSEQSAEPHAERLWAYVHGLVSLELAGFRTGTEEERESAYAEALRAGAAILPLGSDAETA